MMIIAKVRFVLIRVFILVYSCEESVVKIIDPKLIIEARLQNLESSIALLIVIEKNARMMTYL